MKENQSEYWRNAIINMKAENQLELAKILIEVLNSNELNSEESDKYDEQLSLKLRLILEKYASQENVLKDKEKVLDTFDKFTLLPSFGRKEVLRLFVPYFLKLVNKAIKVDADNKCHQKGHEYGIDAWDKREWTTYETVRIDLQMIEGYPVKHVRWTRTCPNCGFVEETEVEPQELKERREREEKEEKILKLKKELTKLEGN